MEEVKQFLLSRHVGYALMIAAALSGISLVVLACGGYQMLSKSYIIYCPVEQREEPKELNQQ